MVSHNHSLKWTLRAAALGIAVITVLLVVLQSPKTETAQPDGNPFSNLSMSLTSSAFASGGKIPGDYTCDERNVSPPLHFGTMPANAQTIALIMDDPDAPAGAWTHWIFWNLPVAAGDLKAGDPMAKAVLGRTSFGQPGYGGPCPPSGEHHYYFRAYALDAALTLPPGSDAAALRQAMTGHVVGQAELIGTYSR